MANTAAADIREEMLRVLESYPETEVADAMPILVLLMAQALGREQVGPELKEALADAEAEAEINAHSSPEEYRERTRRLMRILEVKPGIVDAFTRIFQHEQSRPHRDTFTRSTEAQGHQLPAGFGQPAPENTVTGKTFARRIDRLIRS